MAHPISKSSASKPVKNRKTTRFRTRSRTRSKRGPEITRATPIPQKGRTDHFGHQKLSFSLLFCYGFGPRATCMQNTMGTPQTWSHFNMLDLYETLRTLSQCHHLSHKNCACQMQKNWAHHKTWCHFKLKHRIAGRG